MPAHFGCSVCVKKSHEQKDERDKRVEKRVHSYLHKEAKKRRWKREEEKVGQRQFKDREDPCE